jgi:multidrug efflux pump subunit AcrA (membrane-fusion protein)
VLAPFAGIVVKRHVNEGEYAAMMPPTPVITLEEIDPIDLRIQVPSANMDRVHVGDPVRVRFPANAREVMGKIARIVPANDPRTRSFSAIVELTNSDHSLRSGLYAEVEMTQDTVEPAKVRSDR